MAARPATDPGLAERWWDWIRDGRTLWLVGALIGLLLLVRTIPAGRRPKTRAHVILVLGHVAAIAIAAAQKVAGYAPEPYLVAALALELFAGIGIASTFLFRIALPRLGWMLPRILIDIISAVAVVIALIVVGKRMGFSVTGLITTSAVLTAVIGFALQDTLGNMMGGIALQLDQSIRVGDWIRLAPDQPPGRVTEIRWRYTSMEWMDWSTIIVPNSALMKSQVVVLGRRQGEPTMLRRNIDFHVDFRTPPGDVIAAVRSSLMATPVPNMSSEPAPQVLFHGVRESTALYRARYWLTDLAHDDTTDSEVRIRLYYALQRAGISFSIPAQTVFVSSDDEAKKQRHTDRELQRRCQAIAKVDLLSVLGTDERKQLAETLYYAPLARGEAMTREGATDDGLYMIVEGEASVRIGGVDGDEVARLRPGQFFGEMSLMTGEKRSATVVAATDVVTYRLDKPAFEELVQSRPEIAEAVADLLAERRMSLEQARDRLDEATRSRRRMSTKHDILGRIRGFFNLG